MIGDHVIYLDFTEEQKSSPSSKPFCRTSILMHLDNSRAACNCPREVMCVFSPCCTIYRWSNVTYEYVTTLCSNYDRISEDAKFGTGVC